MERTALRDALEGHKNELTQQLRQMQAAIDTLLEQQRSLADQQADVRRRIEAIDLLVGQPDSAQAELQPSLVPVADLEEAAGGDLAGKTVADACARVLAERARPMRVKELTEELVRRGRTINSPNPEQTVGTTLYRNPRFRRTGPGVFKLEQNVQTGPPQRAPQSRLNRVGPVLGSVSILKSHGAPMHVKELLSALRASGFKTNARRPEAMLSGTLRRSKRFKPKGNDRWALAEWD